MQLLPLYPKRCCYTYESVTSHTSLKSSQKGILDLSCKALLTAPEILWPLQFVSAVVGVAVKNDGDRGYTSFILLILEANLVVWVGYYSDRNAGNAVKELEVAFLSFTFEPCPLHKLHALQIELGWYSDKLYKACKGSANRWWWRQTNLWHVRHWLGSLCCMLHALTADNNGTAVWLSLECDLLK